MESEEPGIWRACAGVIGGTPRIDAPLVQQVGVVIPARRASAVVAEEGLPPPLPGVSACGREPLLGDRTHRADEARAVAAPPAAVLRNSRSEEHLVPPVFGSAQFTDHAGRRGHGVGAAARPRRHSAPNIECSCAASVRPISPPSTSRPGSASTAERFDRPAVSRPQRTVIGRRDGRRWL